MSCPTCSHTMQTFGSIGNFWCPRCGTIKRDHPGNDISEAPKLVGRCLDLQSDVGFRTKYNLAAWHRLGIAESISLPGERPSPA